MKRLLKFRVWDVLNRELIYHPNRQFSVRLNGEVVDGNGCPYDEIYPIQQFTGFLDKNGVEIYEGDIFKGGDYKWDAVRFEDGKFIANLKGARVFDLCELFGEGHEEPEVIGNIFENSLTQSEK